MATYSQRPVRSLLHPRRSMETPDTEPLPLYSPRRDERDSDATSIASEAPTYRSDLPPYRESRYTPLVTGDGPPSVGLPYRKFAPGFELRRGGSVGDVGSHSCNMASWGTTRSDPTIRQYKNVVKRRAQREFDITNNLSSLAVVSTSMLETSKPNTSSSMSGIPISIPSLMASGPASWEPYLPNEDADLVGESAAAAARRQRQSRERGMTDREDALGSENGSWSFMMVQMKDWGGRQQSCNSFRRDTDNGRRGKLARRLGFSRR